MMIWPTIRDVRREIRNLYNENLIAIRLQTLASYEYIFHGRTANVLAAPLDGMNALMAFKRYIVLNFPENSLRNSGQKLCDGDRKQSGFARRRYTFHFYDELSSHAGSVSG